MDGRGTECQLSQWRECLALRANLDTGGALVQGNVEDLSNEPYGNGKGTFSSNVKALWVLKGQ